MASTIEELKAQPTAKTLLDVALECIRRGWYVFPCWPKSKAPATAHGFEDASNDEKQIRRWWSWQPDANVAVACGASNLCAMDKDHGHATEAAVLEWLERVKASGRLPRTYAVLTGRRWDPKDPSKPEFGIQLIYSGAIPGSGHFDEDGGSGDVQSIGDYIMAAGCVHDRSGEVYKVIDDAPIEPLPEWVKAMAPERREKAVAATVGDAKADEWKTWLYEYAAHNELVVRDREKRAPNGWWIGVECPWANEHSTGPGSESSTVLGILDGKIAFECSHGTCKAAKRKTAEFKAEMLRLHGDYAAEPGATPLIFIGGKEAQPGRETPEPVPVDWRSLFHTRAETENIAEPKFYIERFLEEEGVMGLVGPARARKSIITLNIIHSLLTGELLFGHFAVLNRPERVLYLCPESGLGSLSRRLKRMGLVQFVGESLFYTSMNSEPFDLDNSTIVEAAKGAIVFVDTAIRFYKGAENDSKDMRLFGNMCHAMIRKGALAVVLLHHTAKGASEITLESGRGSGDFGAFLTFAWGTTLENFDDALRSASSMKALKWRDWEAKAFSLASSGEQENYFLHYIDGSEGPVKLNAKAKAGKAEAMAFARAHPDMTAVELRAGLAGLGIDYSESTCTKMLRDVRAIKVS